SRTPRCRRIARQAAAMGGASPHRPGGVLLFGCAPAQRDFLLAQPVVDMQRQGIDAAPGMLADEIGAAAPLQADQSQVEQRVAALSGEAIARIAQQPRETA